MIRAYLKRINVGLMAALMIGLIPAVPAQALFENSVKQACEGTQLTDTGQCNPQAAGDKVHSTLVTAIDIFSFVVGFISVIMIIIGGLKYITSGGDSNGVNSAKNTILYAVVGLVIVLLAQVIVRFVISRV
jgi:hypothetical protein